MEIKNIEYWVQGCLKNDRQAQKALYNDFAPSMLAICFRYTKSLNDAEDVLQEAFIKIFTHINQLKQPKAAAGWIKTTVIHTCINYVKQNKFYKKQITELINDGNESELALLQEPDYSKYAAKQIAEFIQLLPEDYQLIFNLIAIEHYSAVEVSKILVISENTIRSKYLRARQKLMDILSKNTHLYNSLLNE